MRIRPLRLHLDHRVGLFGLFISCIGNVGCLSHLNSIVLWFEFDLISQLTLGLTADFVLQTSISIYSDFIWLCVKFELGWSQRKLWAPKVGTAWPVCMLLGGSIWHSRAITLVSFPLRPPTLDLCISPLRSPFSMVSPSLCLSHCRHGPHLGCCRPLY